VAKGKLSISNYRYWSNRFDEEILILKSFKFHIHWCKIENCCCYQDLNLDWKHPIFKKEHLRVIRGFLRAYVK
jgi:hypothetical protein